MSADERRRAMDREMASVIANHHTILTNQDYVIQQLTHQHDCIEGLKREMASYREVMREIRELLAALHISSAFLKYVAIVAAAVVSAWHAVKAAWNLIWR